MIKSHFLTHASRYMRHRLFLALSIALTTATAQPLPSNRHTTELTSSLERDAVSALARENFIQAFYVVCKRVSPNWAERALEQQQAWHARNRNHLQVAVAIVDAIGIVIEKEQNVRAKQTYLTSIYYHAESLGNAEAAKWLQGASPTNKIVPSGERCLAQVASLQSLDSEFAETPEQTIHLRAYAKRHFPELAVR